MALRIACHVEGDVYVILCVCEGVRRFGEHNCGGILEVVWGHVTTVSVKPPNDAVGLLTRRGIVVTFALPGICLS